MTSQLDHPPYVPHVVGGQIYSGTICVSALHYDNTPHFSLHNIYGTLESKVTFE